MGIETERTCIVTRAAKPKEELIRFVVSPDGMLVADLTGKLPGRGIYVGNSRLLIAEALAKRLFPKAAEAQITIPEDFLNRLEAQMARRVAEALSLARKAGQVISGFDKIQDALDKGKVAALVHVDDASPDGVKKLRKEGVEVFQNLPKNLLNEVTGRENAVHVAVLAGPAANFFIESARRFALFLA